MKHSRKSKKLTHPPRGEPWVWVTKRLLESPAWRCMTGTDHKGLDRILIEHSDNAGLCNGKLKVPYGHFERHGARRCSILESIIRLSALGIIKRTYQGRRVYGGDKGEAAEYALTWYPIATENNNAIPATNDWKRYPTIEAAERAIEVAMDKLKKERKKARRQIQKPIFPGSKNATGSGSENATREDISSREAANSKPNSSGNKTTTTLNICIPSGAGTEPWSERELAHIHKLRTAYLSWPLPDLETAIAAAEAEIANPPAGYKLRTARRYLEAFRLAAYEVRNRQTKPEANHDDRARVSDPAA